MTMIDDAGTSSPKYKTYVDILDDWGPTERDLYTKYLTNALPPAVQVQFETLFMTAQRLVLYRSLQVLDRVDRLVEHFERREGLIE